MKRFFSILIILSLLAGFISVPSFATVSDEIIEVSADGPVYYYNDFTEENENLWVKAGSPVGEYDTQNGEFNFTYGT